MGYKIDKNLRELSEDELYTYMWNIDGLDKESFTDLVFDRQYVDITLKRKAVTKKVPTTDGHEFVKYMVDLHNQLYGLYDYDLTEYFFPSVINRAVNRVLTSTIHQTPYYSEGGKANLPTYDLNDVAEAYASLLDEYMDKDVLLSFFSDPTLVDSYAGAGSKLIAKIAEKCGDKLKPTQVVTLLPYVSAHIRALSEDVVTINDSNLTNEANTMLYEILRGDKKSAKDVMDMLGRLKSVGSDARRTMIADATVTMSMYRNFLGKYEKVRVVKEVCNDLDQKLQAINVPEIEAQATRNDQMGENIHNALKSRYQTIKLEPVYQPYNRHASIMGYVSSKKAQTHEESISQAETLAKHKGPKNRGEM